MKILILNWRSIKDKYEGGAERATFEFAKVWVKKHNAEVFWISPVYDTKIKEETLDGVNFIYVGFPLTRSNLQLLFAFPIFYVCAIAKYFSSFRGKVDVIMDQVHGVPYLTPLYASEKKIVYIHEVAGRIWDVMYPFPINILGRLAEKLTFLPYKNIKFIANSPSTYKDLISKLKLKEENVRIVQYGVTAPKNDSVREKELVPTVMYLNRLVKMKGIERALTSFPEVLKQLPNTKMWIVGSGEQIYIDQLKQLSVDLKIDKNVEFLGFKDGDEKYDLLSRAHVLVNPSFLEGWGLVNIEANRMGTPVVAFKVRGCIDSVREGVSGYLATDGDTDEYAQLIIKAIRNQDIRQTSIDYSNEFEWGNKADQFYKEIMSLK